MATPALEQFLTRLDQPPVDRDTAELPVPLLFSMAPEERAIAQAAMRARLEAQTLDPRLPVALAALKDAADAAPLKAALDRHRAAGDAHAVLAIAQALEVLDGRDVSDALRWVAETAWSPEDAEHALTALATSRPSEARPLLLARLRAAIGRHSRQRLASDLVQTFGVAPADRRGIHRLGAAMLRAEARLDTVGALGVAAMGDLVEQVRVGGDAALRGWLTPRADAAIAAAAVQDIARGDAPKALPGDPISGDWLAAWSQAQLPTSNPAALDLVVRMGAGGSGAALVAAAESPWAQADESLVAASVAAHQAWKSKWGDRA